MLLAVDRPQIDACEFWVHTQRDNRVMAIMLGTHMLAVVIRPFVNFLPAVERALLRKRAPGGLVDLPGLLLMASLARLCLK